MSAKEKQGFSIYFLIAFGLAWLCQVGGCMALLQQKNAVLYQLALIGTMFCPLLAVLLVQKVFLRQPVGIGWKVQGKRRFWLAAWFGPAVFTLLGAVLYFAVFPSRLDFSCSWLVAAYGGEMDAQTLRSQLGVSTRPAEWSSVGRRCVGCLALAPDAAGGVRVRHKLSGRTGAGACSVVCGLLCPEHPAGFPLRENRLYLGACHCAWGFQCHCGAAAGTDHPGRCIL